MAWSPLALRNRRGALSRRLAARTSALLVSSGALLDNVRKRGAVPSALMLALRAANKLAQTLIDQPSPVGPTAAQRRALLSAAAQIRTLAAGILASGAAADPDTVEHGLSELVARTLTLIEHVTAEPPAIDTSGISVTDRLKE
jgi:hypothetical protein